MFRHQFLFTRSPNIIIEMALVIPGSLNLKLILKPIFKIIYDSFIRLYINILFTEMLTCQKVYPKIHISLRYIRSPNISMKMALYTAMQFCRRHVLGLLKTFSKDLWLHKTSRFLMIYLLVYKLLLYNILDEMKLLPVLV